jgi:hypothetical protein
MPIHVLLTEDSLRTHPRKGREGKGREVANLSFIGNHSACARMNEPLTRPMVGGDC